LRSSRANLARKIRELTTPRAFTRPRGGVVTKAARILPLELKQPAYLSKGETGGGQGIARDISARKGAEEALKDSEEKFRSILETTNE